MKPIIILGHARAGSTLLAAMLNWHSQVGPKPDYLKECLNIGHFLNKIKNHDFHKKYATYVERKPLFLNKLINKKAKLDIGKELITEEIPSNFSIEEMNKHLQKDLKEPRLLIKSPTLSFAAKTIPELFSEYRIIMLYRDPIGFVNSYKKRLGNKFNLKECTNKWNETIEYLEGLDLPAYTTTYNKLLSEPINEVSNILKYSDLEVEPYVNEIETADQSDSIITNKELEEILMETDKNIISFARLL